MARGFLRVCPRASIAICHSDSGRIYRQPSLQLLDSVSLPPAGDQYESIELVLGIYLLGQSPQFDPKIVRLDDAAVRYRFHRIDDSPVVEYRKAHLRILVVEHGRILCLQLCMPMDGTAWRPSSSALSQLSFLAVLVRDEEPAVWIRRRFGRPSRNPIAAVCGGFPNGPYRDANEVLGGKGGAHGRFGRSVRRIFAKLSHLEGIRFSGQGRGGGGVGTSKSL